MFCLDEGKTEQGVKWRPLPFAMKKKWSSRDFHRIFNSSTTRKFWLFEIRFIDFNFQFAIKFLKSASARIFYASIVHFTPCEISSHLQTHMQILWGQRQKKPRICNTFYGEYKKSLPYTFTHHISLKIGGSLMIQHTGACIDLNIESTILHSL